MLYLKYEITCMSYQLKFKENKMSEMQKNSPTAALLSHHWRPFSLCLTLAALLQLSGYNIFIYYSVIIFDIVSPDVLHPYDPSIIAVFCMLLSYVFVLTVSYRLKRRHLLLISMIGMAGLHFLLGKRYIVFYEDDVIRIKYYL